MTLFPKPITVRRNTGSLVRGVWTPSPASSFIAQGSVQPISGREFDALPVNRQDGGSIKIYSDLELLPSQEGTSNSGDTVEYDGKLWEVWQSQKNGNDLIPHYKSIAQYKGVI